MKHDDLEMLVRAHGAEIYRYVKYLGAGHALAEDIAQETFVAAFQSKDPPPMQEINRRRAWLRGIARNLFLARCRKERADPVIADNELVAAAEAYWADRAAEPRDINRALAALDDCLASLPDRSRKILRMRYEQNLPRREMADALSMQAEGVKTALRRLREVLADCIASRIARETGT